MIMKTMKANLICKVLDVSEYSTKFHIGRFLRIFSYHLIYWYFGPLLTVPLVTFFDSMSLSKNMGFMLGSKDKFSLITQFLQFLIASLLVIF